MNYNKLDVLLMKAGDTSYVRPIMSLEFLKEYLLANGVSCDISNSRTDPEIIMNPCIIGLSGFPEDVYNIKERAYEIKEVNPGINVIVGGQVSIFHEELLKNESIDAVCWGEGEETLLEYALAVKNNESTLGIKGLYQRGSDFVKRKPIDVNTLETTAYSGEDLCGIAQLSTIRGCNGNCSFCEAKYFNQGLRVMNAEKVIEWVSKLRKHHKSLKRIQFMDDNFMVDPDRAELILDYLSKNDMKALFLSRADGVVNNSSLFNDYSGNIEEVSIGIESFSQSQLDRWNKNITVAENNKALNLLRRDNIYTESFIILSDGKTTIDELEEQVKGVKKAPATIYNNHELPFNLRNHRLFTVLRTRLDGDKTCYPEIVNIKHLSEPQRFLDETEVLIKKLFDISISKYSDALVKHSSKLASERLNIYMDGVKSIINNKQEYYKLEKEVFERYVNGLLDIKGQANRNTI